MQEQNKKPLEDELAGKSYGQQGIDKAPGEEVPEGNTPIVYETQKGKKVDADPTEEEGQPVKEDDI